MKIGKYIYISGIIRHIYNLETDSKGVFVRNLFWIHPNTKVIHPSNRGLLSYLDKDEAQNIINKKPQLISDLELYKKNQSEINRYYKFINLIKSKKISKSRSKKIKLFINEFENNKIFYLFNKLKNIKFREILASYNLIMKNNNLYPELWEAFIYAKYYTKSYKFNGKILSYKEVKYLDFSYTDCVETFFRNICIIANFRPNKFKNLKEDTYNDHILWIKYLLTLSNFEYSNYPEIKSTEKNLFIFLDHHKLKMEDIGFTKKNNIWILANEWFKVEAYLIPSHASIKVNYLNLQKKYLSLKYKIYLEPNPKNFLDINNISKTIRFIKYYKNNAYLFQSIYKFLLNNYNSLEKYLNNSEKKICYNLVQQELNILGKTYFSKVYPNEYQQIILASKIFSA